MELEESATGGGSDGNFTAALGVQCNFCHVPRDFASDANPHKDVARGMLRMVQHINGTDLKAIAGLSDAKVTCYSCHRGATKPATEAPAPVAAAPAGAAPVATAPTPRPAQ